MAKSPRVPDPIKTADAFLQKLDGIPALGSYKGEARVMLLAAVLIVRAIDRNTAAIQDNTKAVDGMNNTLARDRTPAAGGWPMRMLR